MRAAKLPYRQIHLDFHTSEHIDNIAQKFYAIEFANTLKQAAVNSVTLFSRCHHGWLYYDSVRFPERVHPNLKNRNLLKEQVSACQQAGIATPVYVTVQWDNYSVEHYPEWLVRDKENKPISTYPHIQPNFYTMLCLNTEFKDFVLSQTLEIFDVLEKVDGFFFDTIFPIDCHCEKCRADMLAHDVNINDSEARMRFSQQVMDDFKTGMSRAIRNLNSDSSIFYNTPQVGYAQKHALNDFSHFEIESLPSGKWGYTHFPLTARYARTLAMEIVGMTGKFHTSWGDFHSFKNPAALEYECFRALAMNCKCSIGDQLHPSGRLSQASYKLIGEVYRKIKEKEPWCEGAHALTDIAVFNPEEFYNPGEQDSSSTPTSLTGVFMMLQELKYQFDVIDTDSEFGQYKVLILADDIPCSPGFVEKLQNYLSNNGCLICTYKSGMDKTQNSFVLPELGIDYIADTDLSPDFIVADGELAEGLYNEPYVMYLPGVQIQSNQAEVLCYTEKPYFKRSHEHYCSHMHTPSSGEQGTAAIVQNKNVIYFSHPIFRQYSEYASLWCKKLFQNALNRLLPSPLVEVNGPSTLEVTLNTQVSKNRDVIHLLHYIPEKRSKNLYTVEEIIPLFDIEISVRLRDKNSPHVSVALQPQNQPVEHEIENEKLLFKVPELYGHQMIELSYR